MSEVMPNNAPVITLIRINAITAAKAPPALSFAQEPPIATAKRICRLLMMAQPMLSIVLPTVKIILISAPAIWTSFPTLIIRPAAGITAITAISTFPSFCKKSKLMDSFFFSCFGSDAASWFSSVISASVPSAFCTFASSGFAATAKSSLFPASTCPGWLFTSIFPSIPPQIKTGVIGLSFLSSRNLRSISASTSPAFTVSPCFTCTLKHSPFNDTVSRPAWIRSSIPSSVFKPYA